MDHINHQSTLIQTQWRWTSRWTFSLSNMINHWSVSVWSTMDTRVSKNNSFFWILNNLFAVQFNYIGDQGSQPMISGLVLNGDRYSLEQFHFHWGLTRGVGSEHTVNGQSYSVEVTDFESYFPNLRLFCCHFAVASSPLRQATILVARRCSRRENRCRRCWHFLRGLFQLFFPLLQTFSQFFRL